MFKNNRAHFDNLLEQKEVPTLYPIQTIIISYNSKWAITTSKASEREYWVRLFSLKTYEQGFSEKFGNGMTDYIKMKEVEQNPSGTKYALCYYNDGEFKVRTFGEPPDSTEIHKRSQDDID